MKVSMKSEIVSGCGCGTPDASVFDKMVARFVKEKKTENRTKAKRQTRAAEHKSESPPSADAVNH
jgi:hypothetical protein